MKVHQLQVGDMQNFTYIVEDEETGEAIVIDPSWDLIDVLKIIERNNLKLKYIVNTHHHFDHTLGNEAMAKATGAKIIQHKASALRNDLKVSDGDAINFGNSQLRILHTPGHSKDSICLVGDGKIFTGDTLFVENCGRVDLLGGSARELYHSLFDVVCKQDETLELFPGHNYGQSLTSTIGKEKRSNFVLIPRSEDEFIQFMNSE